MGLTVTTGNVGAGVVGAAVNCAGESVSGPGGGAVIAWVGVLGAAVNGAWVSVSGPGGGAVIAGVGVLGVAVNGAVVFDSDVTGIGDEVGDGDGMAARYMPEKGPSWSG